MTMEQMTKRRQQSGQTTEGQQGVTTPATARTETMGEMMNHAEVEADRLVGTSRVSAIRGRTPITSWL